MELDKLCRLCLSKWDLQCSIYLDMLKPDSLYHSILKTVDIKIENHYGWPYLICRSCWTIVKAMNSFRNMVTCSDIRLRSYLKKFKPDIYPADEWDLQPPPLASTVILPKLDFAKLCSFISRSTNSTCDNCEVHGTNLLINYSYDSDIDTVEEIDKSGSASTLSAEKRNIETTIDSGIITPRTKVEILQSENKKLLIIFDKHEDIDAILPPLVASNPLLFEPNSLVRTREVFNQLICRGINPFDTGERERLKTTIDTQCLSEESFELQNDRAVSSLASHRITSSPENVSNELSDTNPVSSEQIDNNFLDPCIQVHEDLSNVKQDVTAVSEHQTISSRSMLNIKCELSSSAQNRGVAQKESLDCNEVRIKEELDLNEAMDANDHEHHEERNEYSEATDIINKVSEDNGVEFEGQGSPLTIEESSVDCSNTNKSRVQYKQKRMQNHKYKSMKISEAEERKVRNENENDEPQSTSSGTYKKVRLWNKSLEMSIKKESNILLNYLQFRATFRKYYLCIHCKKLYYTVNTLHEHLRSLYRVGAFCPIGECTYVILEEVEYLRHVGVHYKTAIIPDCLRTTEIETSTNSSSVVNSKKRMTELTKKNLRREMSTVTTKFKELSEPKEKMIVLKGREIHQSPPRKKFRNDNSEDNSGQSNIHAISKENIIESNQQGAHSSSYISPLPDKNCKSARNVAANMAYNTRANSNKSIVGRAKNDSPTDQVVECNNANSVNVKDPSCGSPVAIYDTKNSWKQLMETRNTRKRSQSKLEEAKKTKSAECASARHDCVTKKEKDHPNTSPDKFLET